MKQKKFIILIAILIFISIAGIITAQTVNDMARQRRSPYDYGLKKNNAPEYTGTARDYARRKMHKRGYTKRRYSGASRRRNMRSHQKYKRKKNNSKYKPNTSTRSYYGKRKYRVVTAKTSNIALQNQLNKFAKMGWRLKAVMRNKLIFEK